VTLMGTGRAAAAQPAPDRIDIDALRLRCMIGCSQEERQDRFDVVFDLSAHRPGSGPLASQVMIFGLRPLLSNAY